MTQEEKQKIDEQLHKLRAILEAGEPIFILRGQDVLAPECVRHWSARAARECVNPQKVGEAWAISNAMEAWNDQKIPD
jgi:hypothetical protein